MRTISLLFFTSLLLPACSFQLGSSTPGVDGKASFTYSSSLFGSSDTAPMMIGTREPMRATGASLAVFNVTSSDPSVIEVSIDMGLSCLSTSDGGSSIRSVPKGTRCNAGETSQFDFEVWAVAAGTARIALVDESGKEIDATMLSVAAPAALTFDCAGIDKTGLGVGGSCVAVWSATDARGRVLQATRGVKLTSSDASILSFDDILGDRSATADGDQSLFGTQIRAHGIGTATITATAAGGPTASKTITVTH